MKLFTCTNCGNPVYFENIFCVKCNASLGFDAQSMQQISLIVEKDGQYRSLSTTTESHFKYCYNHQYSVCNWLIPAESSDTFCIACSPNRTIPDLSKPEWLNKWHSIEKAKRRLFYQLLNFKLPLNGKGLTGQGALVFDFVADDLTSDNRVFTGHDNGLITINIAEADDIEREMARMQMAEVYRTLLGHFRHEIGHYYWDQLIDNTPNLETFRNLFGDERRDYSEALNSHYLSGAPTDWNLHYISAYASAHPWEDWAETWAHYLHAVDTLETAYFFWS